MPAKVKSLHVFRRYTMDQIVSSDEHWLETLWNVYVGLSMDEQEDR